MSRATDAAAIAKDARIRAARELAATRAKAVLERLTAPVVPCTAAERAAYDGTLVGITHVASHWYRDDDGALVLVMAPRGAGVGQAIGGPVEAR